MFAQHLKFWKKILHSLIIVADLRVDLWNWHKSVWELHWDMMKELGRFHPFFLQATKALRESRGIALLCFETSELEGGERSALRPGRFLPPGKTRYPLYSRLGGPKDRSGQVRKISPPPGFDPRTVQSVASRYTDWATGPTDERTFVCKPVQELHHRFGRVTFLSHSDSLITCSACLN
jgi:hypothetical protein